jgi:hypothetical protein
MSDSTVHVPSWRYAASGVLCVRHCDTINEMGMQGAPGVCDLFLGVK